MQPYRGSSAWLRSLPLAELKEVQAQIAQIKIWVNCGNGRVNGCVRKVLAPHGWRAFDDSPLCADCAEAEAKLTCSECGHVRLNEIQAGACCGWQGDDCPDCARDRRFRDDIGDPNGNVLDDGDEPMTPKQVEACRAFWADKPVRIDDTPESDPRFLGISTAEYLAKQPVKL
jgi:hypothetical protein